jgi:catechol 2,3-dioxygenase
MNLDAEDRMDNFDNANSPKKHFGAFNPSRSLGIDRAHYVALQANDPAAAARFAVEHLGFFLVHVDGEGRHYLGAHGLDPYSLVYSPGTQGKVDHISYVVHHIDDLVAAQELLTQAKIECEAVSASPLWRHGPALRFKNPGGSTIELTTGINTPVPMAAAVAAPQSSPAPICFDHAIVRAIDVSKAYEFAALTMGLKESARIVAPDGIPVLGFFRSHTLFHCYGVARSERDGLHHIQFTLKTPLAIFAAYDKMKKGQQAKLIWGPLRHGAGHNVAFYVFDYTGTIVEFSAEEEIVLNDANYVPRSWPVTDPHAADEWNKSDIPPEMKG